MEINYQASRKRIEQLDCIVVEPAEQAIEVSKLAVFCHGFGANCEDLFGLAGEILQVAKLETGVRMIFPNAPLSLAEQGIPGGFAWWMLSVQRLIDAMESGDHDAIRKSCPEGIEDARNMLVEVVESELKALGLDERSLTMAGFSQGAMLSVEAACLGLNSPPANLCLFSGALICEDRWKSKVERLHGTRVFQSHGSIDPILPLITGEWLRDLLQGGGNQVDFHEFHGPHTIPPKAIEVTAQLLSDA